MLLASEDIKQKQNERTNERAGCSGFQARSKDQEILEEGGGAGPSNLPRRDATRGFQARSKDQEILEEGGGAGPSILPKRDHE